MKRIVPLGSRKAGSGSHEVGTRSLSMCLVTIALCITIHGADCPRFRGPASDRLLPEAGLLKEEL